ncbi:MAG: hypothetical protein ACLGIZ_15445 [Acidimicrobiia bacterium]
MNARTALVTGGANGPLWGSSLVGSSGVDLLAELHLEAAAAGA